MGLISSIDLGSPMQIPTENKGQSVISKNQDGGEKSHGGMTALVFVGLILPTAVTLVYFSLLRESHPAIQQTAYAVGKGLQFALPILAYVWFRPRVHEATEWGKSAGMGVLLGITIAGAMLALYCFALEPWGVMEGPRVQATEKLAETGLSSLPVFLGVAIFYSIIHSALEEYYWRWFVLRLALERWSVPVAIALSSLGFMAHHVIVLQRFFGTVSPWTYLFSLSVAVGGGLWGMLYVRYRTLLGPWLSHMWVDAAIFLLAYWLVFQS